MKKGDILWLFIILIIAVILILPFTHEIFVNLTAAYPYLGGFVKFSILATMGELLVIRINSRRWDIPGGIIYRAFVWGFLGIVIVLVFNLFASGVTYGMKEGLLPGGKSLFAFAFFTSAIMNLTFAPTMMAFHHFTDTFIDLKYKNKCTPTIKSVVNNIDWYGFISFVIFKTIPLFWIPAHTITFMLPAEYRVLMAAILSIALGIILAFAKRKNGEVN